MNQKVIELIEDTAKALFLHEQEAIVAEECKHLSELSVGELHRKDWSELKEEDREYWREKAIVALSNLGLALIEGSIPNIGPEQDEKAHLQVLPVIPLAEALKELEHTGEGINNGA